MFSVRVATSAFTFNYATNFDKKCHVDDINLLQVQIRTHFKLITNELLKEMGGNT